MASLGKCHPPEQLIGTPKFARLAVDLDFSALTPEVGADQAQGQVPGDRLRRRRSEPSPHIEKAQMECGERDEQPGEEGPQPARAIDRHEPSGPVAVALDPRSLGGTAGPRLP